MKFSICILMLSFANLIHAAEPAPNSKMGVSMRPLSDDTEFLTFLASSGSLIIAPEKVQEITERFGLSIADVMRRLIPIARTYARPPISNYHVGVAILGGSGTIYLGANIEFPGVPLNQAIHAEQFAVTNARAHGETELVAIALSAAPCGHCRQFMSEMGGHGKLQVLIRDSSPVPLSSLLPDSFGPNDLGLEGNLLTTSVLNPLSLGDMSSVQAHAIKAATASYAPYTNAKSGVAIQTSDGTIYSGSYLENAAFNPSLSPLHAALLAFVADGRDYSEIKEVVLVEHPSAKISHEIISREILKHIAPEAVFINDKIS